MGSGSAAAFWLAVRALGCAVAVTGLRRDSLQGDRAAAALCRCLPEEVDLTDIPDLLPPLALLAALFAWVLGLGTGIIAAIRQNSLVDHLFMGVSLAGVSMPIFMVALLLQYLFAFKIKAFPLTLDGTFLSMILPAIALGWNSAGSIARMTRSSLLEVMQADYIDTARAKGLRKQAVILGHALKNSMLPVITMMALQFSGMLSGAVITESIFAIPGIGRLATTAIQNRDMPVLQGTVLFTTVLVIAGNLIADLLYSVLDPRIRKEA